MRSTLPVRAAVIAAVAAGLICVPVTTASAAATSAQHDRVSWQAVSDPRWEVRKAASFALNENSDDAITDWLAFGYNAAVRRASTFERNNISEIKYALRTSTSDSITHFASDRALRATHDEKDDFVRYGLPEARRRDAAGDKQHHDEVSERIAEDRVYVAELAATDPGAQVRSAARFAANSPRDEDVAEFFTYYWAAGARLDDEAFRLRLAELDAVGNADLLRLQGDALDAQAAEKGASGEAAAKLHAQTVAAWSALATAADATSVDWAAERDRASTQAAAWQSVADRAAGATTDQDWAGIAARAGSSLEAWTAAMERATQQSLDWQVVAAEARIAGGQL